MLVYEKLTLIEAFGFKNILNRVLKCDVTKNLFLEFSNLNNIKDHHEILSNMQNWPNMSKIG